MSAEPSESIETPHRVWLPPAAQLFLVSFLGLFLELALIRFVNSTVQVVAYFNNFLILSAFLGLGFGSYLVPQRRDAFRFLPLALPSLLLLLLGLDRFGYVTSLTDQVFWARAQATNNIPVPLVMLLVFAANFAFFTPIGYKLGSCLASFENRLVAYSWDLLGSFAGVAIFTVVSFLGLEPWVWFSFAALIVIALLSVSASRRELALAAVLLAAGIGLSTVPPPGFWSPYYKVSFAPYRFSGKVVGFAVLVDKLRIQDVLELSPALEATPLRGWLPYYRLPYRFRSPGRVLVLGGGGGNDTAMALRFKPERVDVVEIDPVLIAAGHELHPERPYADPRVHVVNNDARAFLRQGSETWDLIVMNALDSHHQLPGLSTLRLESFIYTTDAFRDVRRRMAPDSIFVVHLGSTREWMGRRLFASLTAAFGKEPRLFTTKDSPFGSVAFVYGPEAVLSNVGGEVVELSPADRARYAVPTELATDDWPHLYLESKKLPRLYAQSLALIVTFTVVLLVGPMLTLGRPSQLQMFLLGGGFMLLETRSITQSALLFGATWIVNAVVIGTILGVVFVGNAIVMRGLAPPPAVCWIGLFAALFAGYAINPAFILEYTLFARLSFAAVWIGAPIFFASLIFSDAFRDVTDTAAAFGANLLGVVVGGALEYTSMMWGLNSLYLTTMALYLLALVAGRLAGRSRSRASVRA